MNSAERLERGRDLVADWSRRFLGLGPGQAGVEPIADMATPHFDFFVVYPYSSGPAAEVYAMSDGTQVLASNAEHLSRILREEGFLDSPRVIAPLLFARLYLKMAEVRQSGVLSDPQMWVVQDLPDAVRSEFAAPAYEREGGDVLCRFWTHGPEPGHVERWTVRVAAPDAALSHVIEPVN